MNHTHIILILLVILLLIQSYQTNKESYSAGKGQPCDPWCGGDSCGSGLVCSQRCGQGVCCDDDTLGLC